MVAAVLVKIAAGVMARTVAVEQGVVQVVVVVAERSAAMAAASQSLLRSPRASRPRSTTQPCAQINARSSTRANAQIRSAIGFTNAASAIALIAQRCITPMSWAMREISSHL